MTWFLFKDEMEQKIEEASNGPLSESSRENVTWKREVLYRGKTSKYERIADPSNGEAFWCAVLSLPWHASTNHVATEEKLNMIGSACIRDTDKAHIVKLLDNSQAPVLSKLQCDHLRVCQMIRQRLGNGYTCTPIGFRSWSWVWESKMILKMPIELGCQVRADSPLLLFYVEESTSKGLSKRMKEA